MRGNELLDKMALIDPAYIEAADTKFINRKNVWIKWGAMAACICLIAMAALTLPGGWNEPIAPDTTAPSNQETECVIHNDIATAPYWSSTANDTNGQEILGDKPMVSGYGEGSFPVDMAVTNGGIHYSLSLESAMDCYGDAANYRVLIELFSDGVQISSSSAIAVSEVQRLRDLGYIVAIETVVESQQQGDLSTATATYYFTLHATYEQLTDFPANELLGYSIMLYDEYFDRPLCLDTEVYNGTNDAVHSTVPFGE